MSTPFVSDAQRIMLLETELSTLRSEVQILQNQLKEKSADRVSWARTLELAVLEILDAIHRYRSFFERHGSETHETYQRWAYRFRASVHKARNRSYLVYEQQ